MIHQDKVDINPNTETNTFPIVGIGASAGGLNAFTQLLKALPIDTGMAFVLVQHLDPKHVSLLPDLIKRTTAMPVIEISDNLRVEPNHIYVMPPTHSLALLHGVLQLLPRPDVRGKFLPIDDFLTSLAQDRQNHAIGIILSGTASDGTLGIQAIKIAGGITFAQTEDSAEYDGMPHSAIASGQVDFILPPKEIAGKLVQIAHHPYLKQQLANLTEDVPVKETDLGKIFVLLRAHTGIDFTYYKHTTILRRIKRRMMLHQLDEMKDYVKFLRQHPKELDILFQDMLINVTSFFRDPETFEALKKEVFPRLIEQLANEKALRIWIPACSTGEEVYSIAIALFEFLGNQVNAMHIQIFASDIDKQAIDKARQGIYSHHIDEAVGIERLARFFIKTTNGYQICKSIRDVCVFAIQNVIQDPPFSRINLICCRNLLIYLNTSIQKRVLNTFFYALRPNGFLILGTSETIGSEADLFSLIDRKNKIYLRKSQANPPNTDLAETRSTPQSFSAFHSRPKDTPPAMQVQQAAENLILEKYGPPAVVIDQNMHILYFRGQTGPYIEPATGSASLNLLKMVHPELIIELRALVHQAIKDNNSVRKEGLRMHHHDGYKNINLQIIPLAGSKTIVPSYLVIFEPGAEIPARQSLLQPDNVCKDAKDLRISALENELLAEREYMQSIIEEQEETNEELQSANEEIQSANEELQSINEELETTKEELQSTNEELTTIIEEHENRNQELNQINNDLINLLASIDTPIVILHRNLSIRRFTPAAKVLLNLIDTDTNRPISNIRPNIVIPDLERELKQVIESAVTKSIEVQDDNGHWYLLRLHPYQKQDKNIDGVVMVFIDIDAIKDIEQLRNALQYERRLAAVVRDSNDAVTVQDFNGHILAWNQRAAEMFGYTEDEALQLNANQLIPDIAREEMRTLLKQLQHGQKTPPCETIRCTKEGHLLKVWMTTSILNNGAGNPAAIAITEREIL